MTIFHPMEEAPRERESRLPRALSAAGQGLYEIDVASGKWTVNERYVAMLGYAPAGFREDTSSFRDRLHPDDRRRVIAAIGACFTDQAAMCREEFRLRTVTGAWMWVLSLGAVAERDEEGRALCFIGTHIDITARKAVEEQLRLTASVFESSQDAIIITDAERRIIKANKAFSDITGYSAAEVRGRNPRLLKSGRHDDAFYAAMWEEINRIGSWQGELWDRRKNGEVYPTLSTISAIYDEQGKVAHYIDISADITHYKQAEEHIRHLAYYDPLTGLPNRALLRNRALQALALMQREEKELALLFIDLDYFKTINDTLGHAVGDELLRGVAHRIQQAVRRETDTVSRLGGDEFLVILPDSDAGGAARTAQKLIAAFGSPFTIDGHGFTVTGSVGISMFPKDGSKFDELLKNADTAMYKAKAWGRNRYYFFTPEMNAAALERLTLENALREALNRRQFVLLYQPQIDLGDGRLIGVEALIRWRHPKNGLVPPARFMSVAEDSGLIEQIDQWVLREACRQSKYWQDSGLSLVVAVNLSARQFLTGKIAETIDQISQDGNLNAHLLEIEIPEGLLAQDTAMISATLRQVKAKGIRISIDDFGTGCSSLIHLKRFPLDRLKIDQSFIKHLISKADDRAIAGAVINIGHSLKLRVIAEGVETEQQRDILRQLGCDQVQGFFYGRPLPPDEVAAFQESRGG